ncbi:hypothetical protein BKA70DRAFT_1520660 [Coprinopsis sp. MPI-PUGE-AT-0042]|nr:hypothetical protein BKA70DRAFT_1520660 [Coprinopsis sp. MPI-PUGE-AT-0042]
MHDPDSPFVRRIALFANLPYPMTSSLSAWTLPLLASFQEAVLATYTTQSRRADSCRDPCPGSPPLISTLARLGGRALPSATIILLRKEYSSTPPSTFRSYANTLHMLLDSRPSEQLALQISKRMPSELLQSYRWLQILLLQLEYSPLFLSLRRYVRRRWDSPPYAFRLFQLGVGAGYVQLRHTSRRRRRLSPWMMEIRQGEEAVRWPMPFQDLHEAIQD